MLQSVTWAGGVYCPPTTFKKNVEINRARGLPEITLGEPKDEALYIACSGPSLSDTYKELCDKQTVWALNGAYDWLRSRGIKSVGVCMAPEEQVLGYFETVLLGDKFLLASQTHSDLVTRILDRLGKVTLWHCHCPDEWDVDLPKGQTIFGGGTIGLRVLDLAWVLGYRDLHVLGFDACCSPDGRISVGTKMYEDRKRDLRTFMVKGRAFVALPSHARQVEDFASVIRPLTGLSVTFYGDGLMQWANS